jgi:phenylpropionate dioxygenase-like ring-hydroxylating dioxygenase large terminal subunit
VVASDLSEHQVALELLESVVGAGTTAPTLQLTRTLKHSSELILDTNGDALIWRYTLTSQYLFVAAGVQLETYEFEKFHLLNYQTFEWNGNWKHAWDAFNESYHFGELHPDMIEFGEGHDVPIELLGVHSRMINFNRTVSEIVDDQDTITPLRQHMMLGDQEGRRKNETKSYSGSAKDVHFEEIRRRRAIEDESYLPFEQMNDEQLVHQYHYSFFPSATFTQTPESGAVFRYRPHATDPNICYYDFFVMSHLPPGTPKQERPENKVHRHIDGIDYAEGCKNSYRDREKPKLNRAGRQ